MATNKNISGGLLEHGKNEQCKIIYEKIGKESKIFQEKLLCEQNSCNLSSNPSAEYNWWSTMIKHRFKCFLYKESIIASSEVLGTNCIAKTLNCELEESRLVMNWKYCSTYSVSTLVLFHKPYNNLTSNKINFKFPMLS